MVVVAEWLCDLQVCFEEEIVTIEISAGAESIVCLGTSTRNSLICGVGHGAGRLWSSSLKVGVDETFGVVCLCSLVTTSPLIFLRRACNCGRLGSAPSLIRSRENFFVAIGIALV